MKIGDWQRKVLEAAQNWKGGDLLICTRGKKYHIYYNGGKILGISPQSVTFDLKYLKRKDGTIEKLSYTTHKKDKDTLELDLQKVTDNPEEYFREAKSLMDKWFEENPKPERRDQHMIALKNMTTEKGLGVVDIEFAVSFNANYYNKEYMDNLRREKGLPLYKKYPNPRFDIIAIDQNGQVHIFELKTGLYSLKNAKKHVENFNVTIGNEDAGDDKSYFEKRYMSFLKEISQMIDVINSEKLRAKQPLPQIKYEKPIFHFLFTPSEKDKKRRTKKEQEKIFPTLIKEALDMGVDIAKIDENYILNLR